MLSLPNLLKKYTVMKQFRAFLVAVLVLAACRPAVREDENLLRNLMARDPNAFGAILADPNALEVQVIYTQINRDANNVPSFRSFYFNVDSGRYFYPASTVKLPLVLLALERLHHLNIPGLDKFTPMLHDSVYSGQKPVYADTTAANGQASVGHYARKILVVSDNDAYNRLYEFMGQRETNRLLAAKGYFARILHRLERPLSPDQNRHTEAVRFVVGDSVLYAQPMLVNTDSIRPPRVELRGKGFYRGDSLVMAPFDFTYKNFYPLTTQQAVLRALLFPASVDPSRRFDITGADRRFVLQYMSQLPRETAYPPYYKDIKIYDAYTKFLLSGNSQDRLPANLRIFNKSGDAYGYLLDNAYVVDFEHGVEFMLSAVINTNTDGIYNDGKYAYDSLGFPFMKNLGQLIYHYELNRKREHTPDLSAFRLTYDRLP